MKTICLVETVAGGLNTVKSYLAEMNAEIKSFGTVESLLFTGNLPDLVILLAEKDLASYKADLLKLKNSSSFSNTPRISVLPFHFSMHRTSAGIIEGEQEFFMPLDKLNFLSAAARALNIPQRRMFKIVVTIIPQGGTLKYSGFSVDFSQTGMSFETTADFSPEQSLMISFVNPKNRTRFSLKAVVVRRGLTKTATATFYGVRFTDLTAGDTESLKKFISGRSD